MSSSHRLRRFLHIVARFSLAPVFRLWRATLRYESRGANLFAQPTILAFWHADIFASVGFLTKSKSQRLAALVSPSPDGILLAGLLSSLNVQTVFGSSSEQGFRGFMDAAAQLSRGFSLMVTPDGPTGPARRLKSGAVQLARYSACPMVFLSVSYTRTLHFNSWDKFVLPMPFSKCRITPSEILRVDRSSETCGDATRKLESWIYDTETHPGVAQPAAAH